MERIPGVDMVELDQLIATEQANAQSELWGDDDLTDKIDAQGFETQNPLGIFVDRRIRANVAYFQAPDGSWQPTVLKQYDHVMLLGIAPVVVAMPARGRGCFLAYAPEYYGQQLVTLEWQSITDRAPADENEAPMPINVLPPSSEPPPEGTVTITTTIASHDDSATLTTTIDDAGIHTTDEGGSS